MRIDRLNGFRYAQSPSIDRGSTAVSQTRRDHLSVHAQRWVAMTIAALTMGGEIDGVPMPLRLHRIPDARVPVMSGRWKTRN
jgi:hypothetical protein